jgi:protein TonB
MNSIGLKWFVALSVAVHGVLLLSWKQPAFEIGNTGQILQLAMADISGASSTAAAKQTATDPAVPEPSEPPQRKPVPSGQHTAHSSSLPADNSAAEAPVVPGQNPRKPQDSTDTGKNTAAAGGPDSTRQEADRHLRKSLFELVTARLTYPALARHKGWQGTVRLELHIEPDGQITRLRIDATSGYPLLDQAAVRSLTLASVPRAGRWLNGHAIDIVIPVEYRLLDG